ncbi:MAG TPA: DUF1223 domain-containing protein, partial [Phenylobacterium sp.]|nr:DUF1223 domain-containing protein [Phenylobacterium sp.]
MKTAALAALLFLITPAAALAAKPPVVVEFYTAQGCAACVEANGLVNSLAERPGVVALTFPVDHWDYLGWADTFAKPEFAERQKAYLAPLALREPYTPQLVIHGMSQASAVEAGKVEDLLNEAARTRGPAPDIQFIGPRRVDVGSGPVPRGGGEVWMVRYDPQPREVVVRRGENRGQTLEQRNVVRRPADPDPGPGPRGRADPRGQAPRDPVGAPRPKLRRLPRAEARTRRPQFTRIVPRSSLAPALPRTRSASRW